MVRDRGRRNDSHFLVSGQIDKRSCHILFDIHGASNGILRGAEQTLVNSVVEICRLEVGVLVMHCWTRLVMKILEDFGLKIVDDRRSKQVVEQAGDVDVTNDMHCQRATICMLDALNTSKP